MTNNDWKKIEKYINDGIYRTVRLVEKKEGQKDVTVITGNSVSSKKEDCLAKAKYIRGRINQGLPVGKYQVQCKQNGGSLQDTYDFEIKERSVIQVSANGNVIDKTKEQEVMNSTVDLDKYIEMYEELVELRARVPMLEYEVKIYKKKYEDELAKGHPEIFKQSLQENAPEKKETSWADSLKDTLAAMMPVVEKHFEHQDRRIALEEKKLMSQDSKKSPSKKIYKRRDLLAEAEEIAPQLELLCDQDPDQYNAYLDELEEKDPELYETLCGMLDIEEYEEGEEEEDQEQD